MATVALYGQVSTFDPETDDWTQYVERLNYYFVANGIDDATKRRAILLSVVGASTYRLIRNLVAPAKPDEKTYKQLVDLVKEHQCPAPSETVQRFRLNTRMRQPNESISTYVAELRSLIEFCGYPAGEQTNKMLRDRLVCGINNSAIQKKSDFVGFKKISHSSRKCHAGEKERIPLGEDIRSGVSRARVRRRKIRSRYELWIVQWGVEW